MHMHAHARAWTCINGTITDAPSWMSHWTYNARYIVQHLAAEMPFLPLLVRHAFEAADVRHAESLDRQGFVSFVDAIIYFHRNWDRFQFVQ